MASTVRQSFDPRRNSIGFLRWLLATAVLFSHAGPLAGFYGSKNLGTQWSDEQSFGGVAVAGFFFLSGFLITKSRMGRSTIVRFLWRRVLRIMPAFWAALIATAFLLAPLCWWHVHHTLHGYFSASAESPLTYFSNNMWLHMTQHNIAQMGSTLPLAHCCGYDWNGSAWTLIYEFSGYLLIGVLGLVGFLGYRRVALAIFAFWVLLNTVTFLSIPVHVTVVQPLLSNFFAVMLLTPFLFGMVFALYDDKIVIDDRLALAAAGVAFYTYFIAHGWNIYGQFAFLYLVMWCAIRLPITNWERFGDLSYGIYIYAWPIMQVASFFHLYTRGWLAYHVGVLVACHIAAYLSWHLLEKRALALKNWTPQWLLAVQRRAAPSVDRIRTRVDHPDFSSTRFAASRRGSGDAEPATADLVTHDPGARVRLRGPHHGPDPSAPPVGSGRPVRRGRLVVAGSAGLVALLVFVALGWGLPAVYRHRYEPRTLAVSQTGLTGPGGHFAAAHPVPTAAQDAAFAANEPGGDKQTAVLGRDGYYFFGDAYVHNFSEAMGRRYYSPQEVVGTAETLTAQRQWLAARGIAFDFVVAPAKWDIYSDKLPAWTDGQRLPTIYDQLNAYDPNLLVDLRPALQSGRITGDTYSPTEQSLDPVRRVPRLPRTGHAACPHGSRHRSAARSDPRRRHDNERRQRVRQHRLGHRNQQLGRASVRLAVARLSPARLGRDGRRRARRPRLRHDDDAAHDDEPVGGQLSAGTDPVRLHRHRDVALPGRGVREHHDGAALPGRPRLRAESPGAGRPVQADGGDRHDDRAGVRRAHHQPAADVAGRDRLRRGPQFVGEGLGRDPAGLIDHAAHSGRPRPTPGRPAGHRCLCVGNVGRQRGGNERAGSDCGADRQGREPGVFPGSGSHTSDHHHRPGGIAVGHHRIRPGTDELRGSSQ